MCLIEIGKEVLKTLNEAGFEAYFVGGMVRDQLLNRPIYDIDITTSATPNDVMSLFEKTIPTGLQHGTVTVLIQRIPVEITTFRKETTYVDYRRPSEVFFTDSLSEDLKRRDFTMNAIAKDINDNLYDPYQGLDDLAKQCIKAVGTPFERFEEDPLRMLRAIRFVSKLDFDLHPKTYDAIKEKAPLIAHISKERIKKELDGMMSGMSKQDAVQYLIDTTLVDDIEGFEALNLYKNYSFNRLTQGLDLFILVALTHKDVAAFLAAWPLSREEVKIIKLMVQLQKNPQHPSMVLYRYQTVIFEKNHNLRQFLNQENEPLIMPKLPITNRKELAINGSMLQKVVGLQSGPWIQQVLENIEEQVILGGLNNDLESIKSYIKTMNIGEINEKKK